MVNIKNHCLNKREIPLSFRFHVSMCGNLGIVDNIISWNEEEFLESKKWISLYKNVREIIQHGLFYRTYMASFHSIGFFYIDIERKKAVWILFSWGKSYGRACECFYPVGLSSLKKYKCSFNEKVLFGEY